MSTGSPHYADFWGKNAHENLWRVFSLQDLLVDFRNSADLACHACRYGQLEAGEMALRGAFRTDLNIAWPAARRGEYLAGRLCAHAALVEQGLPPSQVVVSRALDGRPCWPQGYVGSISHSRGVAIAMVGSAQRHQNLGVDIQEYVAPHLATSLAKAILFDRETRLLSRAGMSFQQLVTLAFSAKEALYKSLYSPAATSLSPFDLTILYLEGSILGMSIAKNNQEIRHVSYKILPKGVMTWSHGG